MTHYTNAAIDALAAAVPTPYGPLVRVTDMSTLGNPNGNYTIELTDSLGTSVFVKPAELADPEAILKAISYVEGNNYMIHELLTTVASIYAVLNPLIIPAGGPYADDVLETIFDQLSRIHNLSAFGLHPSNTTFGP